MAGTFIFSGQREQNERTLIKRYFSGSIIFHIVLLLMVVLIGAWVDSRPRVVFQSVQAKLVKLGKERDKRLLPRIVKKKTPIVRNKKKEKGNSLKKTAKKVKKIRKPKKEVAKKQHKSLQNLLSGAMKDIERDARAEESDEGAKNGVENGDVTDPTLAAKGNLYARKVAAIIRSNWKIPSLISKNDLPSLKSVVYFRITFSGEVYNISISRKSGNSLFDNSVIEALKRTEKLPLPTDKHLRKIILKEGFECPFTAG